MIALHDEVSFGLLRYFLGEYRPSQTARLALSSDQIHGLLLETKTLKTSISLATPLYLATEFHSLPVILHMSIHASIPGYSKGSRGLFVPLQENRIFTATTVSPSFSLRQCLDR